MFKEMLETLSEAFANDFWYNMIPLAIVTFFVLLVILVKVRERHLERTEEKAKAERYEHLVAYAKDAPGAQEKVWPHGDINPSEILSDLERILEPRAARNMFNLFEMARKTGLELGALANFRDVELKYNECVRMCERIAGAEHSSQMIESEKQVMNSAFKELIDIEILTDAVAKQYVKYEGFEWTETYAKGMYQLFQTSDKMFERLKKVKTSLSDILEAMAKRRISDSTSEH